MSNLLDEIRGISKEAAHELECAGFKVDSDISALDRQDLFELLPGKDKLRVRKEIHKLICRKPKDETILKDRKDFFLSDLLADGFTDKDALLEALRKMKACTHELIDLLETNRAGPPKKPGNQEAVNNASSARHGQSSEGSASDSSSSNLPRFSLSPWNIFSNRSFSFLSPSAEAKDTSGPIANETNKAVCNIISKAPTVMKKTVMYKMVVSGKTLEKHLDVIKRLSGQVPGHSVSLQLTESQRDEDSKVTIVFCPVVSRVGTDIDVALQGISSDKPIIVVAMHHLHTATSMPPPPTMSRVELGVNVFFHESRGLLDCSQNDNAINEIKVKLLEYSSKRSYMNP